MDEITSLALSQMLGGHRFEGGLDVTGVHIVNIRNHQLPLIFEFFFPSRPTKLTSDEKNESAADNKTKT